MARTSKLVGAGLVSLVAGVGFGFPASAAEVTYERLLNAKVEPHNWLFRHGSYDQYNASALSQINRSNVANLQVKFMASIMGEQLGVRQYFTPLVNDGFMYVSNGWHEYTKYDVRGGQPQIVWKWDAGEDKEAAVAGGVIGFGSLSVALFGNNMYTNTSYPARLIAVDVDSGEPVFDVSTVIPDVLPDQRHTAAPLALKDMIIVGNSRGDGGNRGHVSAYKADSGEFVWSFVTIPGPGEPGHQTWSEHSWETGGAAVWMTPSFDPDLNLIYFGTGNPWPYQDPQWRPGDNLYTNSTIALDVDSGEMKWFFQETPNESWDYDTLNNRFLVNVNVGGEMRRVVSNVSRDGFYYSLDAASGEFLFAEPWTTVTWTAGLDPKTGMPVEYIPGGLALQDYGGKAIKYGMQDSAGQNVCPHHGGAPTLWPSTYDSSRNMVYFASSVNCGNYYNTRAGDPVARAPGAGAADRIGLPTGLIGGIDVASGKLVKELRFAIPPYAGVLGTPDLLFTGHSTGHVSAYDKDTLAELWSFNTGTPIAVNPMTYAVNGKQYIALTIGGGLNARITPNPEIANIPRNAMLIVFGL